MSLVIVPERTGRGRAAPAGCAVPGSNHSRRERSLPRHAPRIIQSRSHRSKKIWMQSTKNWQQIKEAHTGLLVACEEAFRATIEQTEAPLRFATTSKVFVAEGWVPADRTTGDQRGAGQGDRRESLCLRTPGGSGARFGTGGIQQSVVCKARTDAHGYLLPPECTRKWTRP